MILRVYTWIYFLNEMFWMNEKFPNFSTNFDRRRNFSDCSNGNFQPLQRMSLFIRRFQCFWLPIVRISMKIKFENYFKIIALNQVRSTYSSWPKSKPLKSFANDTSTSVFICYRIFVVFKKICASYINEIVTQKFLLETISLEYLFVLVNKIKRSKHKICTNISNKIKFSCLQSGLLDVIPIQGGKQNA